MSVLTVSYPVLVLREPGPVNHVTLLLQTTPQWNMRVASYRHWGSQKRTGARSRGSSVHIQREYLAAELKEEVQCLVLRVQDSALLA